MLVIDFSTQFVQNIYLIIFLYIDKVMECSIWEYKCDWDNKCIDTNKKCDGYKDCTDGADELGCGTLKLLYFIF